MSNQLPERDRDPVQDAKIRAALRKFIEEIGAIGIGGVILLRSGQDIEVVTNACWQAPEGAHPVVQKMMFTLQTDLATYSRAFAEKVSLALKHPETGRMKMPDGYDPRIN